MQNETSREDDNDSDFEQELKGLYRAALLDETFQQQVKQDLRSLPGEVSAKQREEEIAFLEDEELSPGLQRRLLAVNTVKPPAVASPKPSWWQQLWRPLGWQLLPAPGFSLSAVLLVGVGLGAVSTSLLSGHGSAVGNLRGNGVSLPSTYEPSSPADQLPAAVQADLLQRLNAINTLLSEGETEAALQKIQALQEAYIAPPAP